MIKILIQLVNSKAWYHDVKFSLNGNGLFLLIAGTLESF